MLEQFCKLVQHIAGAFYKSAPALFIGLFLVLPGGVRAFQDVPADHPDFLAIQQIQEMAVIQGYPDNTFRPDATINRAEAVKVIVGGRDAINRVSTEGSVIPFTDVRADDWFYPYVRMAFEKKIVQGEKNGTLFNPARQVNRAEFIAMLFRAHSIKTSEAVA